jgi:hypothetical protein
MGKPVFFPVFSCAHLNARKKALINCLDTAEHLIKVGHDQGIAPVVDLLRSPEESVQQVFVVNLGNRVEEDS